MSWMMRRQPIVWQKRSLEKVSRALFLQLVQRSVSDTLGDMEQESTDNRHEGVEKSLADNMNNESVAEVTVAEIADG